MTIQEVWEKYRHLDVLFSDPVWMQEDDNLIRNTLFDVWTAVKDAVTMSQKTQPE